MILKIATSQFPVSSDIEANQETILRQMTEARAKGCDVIHLPEGSLSGYAGVDFHGFENYNWEKLKTATLQIIDWAKDLQLWTILGSSHPLSGENKPHNSLYIINDKGEIEDRYDKLFCAGNEAGTIGDLSCYTPGDHFSTFEMNGVTCGVLICHDYRYPELYRELNKRGVQVVFHSYHAGNITEERQIFMESQVGEEHHSLNPGKTYPEITMPAGMIASAGNNYVWISCSNTSAKESCWGAFMVRPDGVITGRLERNKDGILVTEVNTTIEYYDSTRPWRQRAMDGVFHSGELVDDARSKARNKL